MGNNDDTADYLVLAQSTLDGQTPPLAFLQPLQLINLNYINRIHCMSHLPPCPKCHSEYTYEDNAMYVCPECSYEWSQISAENADDALIVKDAFGSLLQEGDSVSVIKDLKVKGSSLVVKVGTKVKNIRLIEGDHNIDCKIEGIGAMQLKSEFVKKA